MRLWPWRRAETRASYTDAVVQAIAAQAAGGVTATIGGVGALEAAAGVIGRALAGATVDGPDPFKKALTPEVLGTIGRELIRRGEAVYLIQVPNGNEATVRLFPAGSWDVAGQYDPEGWRYQTHLSGPSGQESRTVAAAAVLHFRYAVDPARPWRGIGPVQAADVAGRLAAGIEGTLANESQGPHGTLIGIPKDGESPTLDNLKRDLGALKGRATLVESGGWDAGPNRGQAFAMLQRLGFNPPAAAVEAHAGAQRTILAACGVPVELVEASEGTGQREAWRRLLFGTVAPMARGIALELQAKLDPGVSLTFPELRASDLAGRARAYKQLTEAGMKDADARELTGFEPAS